MAGDPHQMIAQADKLVSGVAGGFSFFGGGKTQKYEDAARLYKSAGDNLFNDKGAYQEAGKAYEKAGAIYNNNLKETIDYADALDKAAKAYRRGSPPDAARCLTTLINLRKSEGEFRRATKPQQELAELYEQDLGDRRAALAAWETAGRWFENDRAESLANKCFLKVGDLAALEAEPEASSGGNGAAAAAAPDPALYTKATENFEKVAQACVSNNLMRFSVKDYLLKAGIVYLAAGDSIATQRALERFRGMDPGFAQQREHQLLVDLMEATESGDGEGFSEKLFQYDQMSKLDGWKTTMLLRVKNKMGEQEEDFS